MIMTTAKAGHTLGSYELLQSFSLQILGNSKLHTQVNENLFIWPNSIYMYLHVLYINDL